MKALQRLVAVLIAIGIIYAGFAYAVDPTALEWKLPAKYRLVYTIDVASATSEDVYVDINIPSYVYDHLVQRLQAGQMCDLVKDNRAPDELYPVIFYASDANPQQRYIPEYSVIEAYEFDTACYDQYNQMYKAKFPKKVRIRIPDLDGDSGTFKNIGHYILVYVPFLYMDTYENGEASNPNGWGWLGAPMITTPGGQGDVYVFRRGSTASVVKNLHIPINPDSQVILKFSVSTTDTWGGVILSFLTTDGTRYTVGIGTGNNPGGVNVFKNIGNGTYGFSDVLYLLSSSLKIPVSSISELEYIKYYSVYRYHRNPNAVIDDVFLAVT